MNQYENAWRCNMCGLALAELQIIRLSVFLTAWKLGMLVYGIRKCHEIMLMYSWYSNAG